MAAPASEDDIVEYQKYLLSQGKSPQDAGEYGDYLRSQASLQNPVDNAARNIIGAVQRVASIPGAVIRAATMGTADAIKDAVTNNPNGANHIQEAMSAVTGKAPSTSDYLSRFGVGDMGSMQVPDWLTRQYRYNPQHPELPAYTVDKPTTITGKQVVGAAGDLASDVAGMNVGGPVLESAGNAIAKVPFLQMDEIARQAGKIPVSQVIQEEGLVPGTYKGMTKNIQDLMGKYGSQLAESDDAVNAAGLRGSINPALERAQKLIDKIKAQGNREKMGIADLMQQDIDELKSRYAETPAVPASTHTYQKETVPAGYLDRGAYRIKETPQLATMQMPVDGNPSDYFSAENPIKENLVQYTKREAIPQKTWYGGESEPQTLAMPAIPEGLGPTTNELRSIKQGVSQELTPEQFRLLSSSPEYSKYLKAKGGGINEQIINLAEAARPGSGMDISDIGAKQGSLISLMDKTESKAVTEAGSRPGSQVTFMGLASGHPGIALANELGRASKLPGAFTYPGYALRKTGQAMKAVGTAVSPWSSLKD